MSIGLMDMLVLVVMLALVHMLIVFSILTNDMEKKQARRNGVAELQRIGILTECGYVPPELNRYRYYCYQQKLEGIRSKGPQGWVTPRHG